MATLPNNLPRLLSIETEVTLTRDRGFYKWRAGRGLRLPAPRGGVETIL